MAGFNLLIFYWDFIPTLYWFIVLYSCALLFLSFSINLNLKKSWVAFHLFLCCGSICKGWKWSIPWRLGKPHPNNYLLCIWLVFNFFYPYCWNFRKLLVTMLLSFPPELSSSFIGHYYFLVIILESQMGNFIFVP